MTPDTFRAWLAEKGCGFDETERQRGEGVAAIRVRRGPRETIMPRSASHHTDLPEEDVRRIVDDLGLSFEELPGQQGRR